MRTPFVTYCVRPARRRAAAGRRRQRGLRQHRRRAERVADADPELRVRCDEDQPLGGRRPLDGPDAEVRRAGRRRASTSKGCRSARAAASGHAQLSARCGVRVPGAGARRSAPLAGQRSAPARIDVTLNGAPVEVDDPAQVPHARRGWPAHVGVALLDERRCEGVDDLYGVDARRRRHREREINGPFEATGTGDTPSRRAIFTASPADAARSCRARARY